MARSVKKGPFIDDHVMKAILGMNARNEKKIHNLGDPSARETFPRGNASLGYLGIRHNFALPAQCQLKGMDCGIYCLSLLIGLHGKPSIRWKRDWLKDKRRRSPSRKWDADGQIDIPASSVFASARGANSLIGHELGLHPQKSSRPLLCWSNR